MGILTSVQNKKWRTAKKNKRKLVIASYTYTNTNFYEIFLIDETSLYLGNPVEIRWLKDHDNLIYFKKKGRKIGAWVTINANSKISLNLYEMNFNIENYLRILEETVEEMREIKNLETQYIQMDYARYHWTTETLEFYRKT